MAPPTTHLLALLTRFCYDDAVAPNGHRKKDLLEVLQKDSMFAITACMDALHEKLLPKPQDERAPYSVDAEPDIRHAQEALKAFGLLCNVYSDQDVIADLLIARWPAALAWIHFLDPCHKNIRPCPKTLYARPADAVALALSGYVQLLYNKGVLNNDRISFKTLLRFWLNFPSHFPAPAAVGGAHQEAEILFRGRDAAVTDLLLRVLTTPDPAGREAAAHAILMEGKGSANRLMRAAASRLTQSLRFAFIPRDRYAYEFPQLADHIVLRYRYAEVCAALVALAPLRVTMSSRQAARDVVKAFHFFAMVSFDRSAALKVCQTLAALCEKSSEACVAALRGGALLALHRFLMPRAGDIVQLRLRKGVDDMEPVRSLADAIGGALVLRPVLKAFGEAILRQRLLKMDNPPSKVWRRLMLRFAHCQLDMEAFERARMCKTCGERVGKVCCADTYYCTVVCQTADRGRHRHTCSAAPTGTALLPLTSSMPLSAKDHKFAVFAADREIKRKGKVRQAISAFLERPAVVKSGRDVHARIDCRKGVPSVMLCLSTGTMREAEPDDKDYENATGKVLLASSHDTAHASPRVIVDVVFSADREMAVVPVGMYRVSTFAPEKAQAKPALVSQPRRASRTPGMFVFGSCHPPERKQWRSTFRSRDTSWAYRFGTGVRHGV
ncbi:hypothetical protein HDZ31DRAFT_48971 [Schizophyllum fasciatum]